MLDVPIPTTTSSISTETDLPSIVTGSTFSASVRFGGAAVEAEARVVSSGLAVVASVVGGGGVYGAGVGGGGMY